MKEGEERGMGEGREGRGQPYPIEVLTSSFCPTCWLLCHDDLHSPSPHLSPPFPSPISPPIPCSSSRPSYPFLFILLAITYPFLILPLPFPLPLSPFLFFPFSFSSYFHSSLPFSHLPLILSSGSSLSLSFPIFSHPLLLTPPSTSLSHLF